MKSIFAAGLNALAFRYGSFGHAGDGLAFLLIFLVFAGVLVWAIADSGGAQLPKN